MYIYLVYCFREHAHCASWSAAVLGGKALAVGSSWATPPPACTHVWHWRLSLLHPADDPRLNQRGLAVFLSELWRSVQGLSLVCVCVCGGREVKSTCMLPKASHGDGAEKLQGTARSAHSTTGCTGH